MGYHRAGFDVVGVDIKSQPRYPFEFHQGDALEWPLEGFNAIHASPPCQRYSAMSACRPGLSGDYPDLIAPIRERLVTAAAIWVIENVPRAPLLSPILLCGRMFDRLLYRHRLFESSVCLKAPRHPVHDIRGGGAGHWKAGEIISVSGNCAPVELARSAMGIGWMRRGELAESIPPAYTEFIGKQLMAYLKSGQL